MTQLSHVVLTAMIATSDRLACRTKRSRFALVALGLLLSGRASANPLEDTTIANYLTQPVAGMGNVIAPIPWLCNSVFNVPDPGTQAVLDIHMNWHCNFDETVNPTLTRFANDGNKFFGFHREFIYAFNRYRQTQGVPFVQTWMPFAGASIPLGHANRPDGAACSNCTTLPNSQRLPTAGGTLDPAVTTLQDYGNGLVPWHNNQHVALSLAGGTAVAPCTDSREILCVTTAPADPMFFRFHNFVNDLQDEILTFQDTDVMIVFDRSGSMTLPSGTAPIRLNAAKDAAQMFTDLLRDNSNNRVGLVSFSTAASPSPELPLTLASSAPSAMAVALSTISANGMTSIGDGLRAALTTLNASTNPHKAILLLTDGVENTPPTIASQVGRNPGQLGDTHLCAVGFGTPGSLDGPKLRDLAETQGGIYLSDPDPLNLKKYFVECFADIFDTFVGKDPIAQLPADRNASDPTIYMAQNDSEVTFTLAWDDPLPKGALRLAVTTPSGMPVNLADPNVESRFGPSWHIVRIKTPYANEQPGQWTARAVRPMRSFVNGFLPTVFADPDQGSMLVQQQIAQLCPDGCRRVLYFEDFPTSTQHGAHNSAYFAALIRAKKSGVVSMIDRSADPSVFAEQLSKGGYDLIVASIGYATGRQDFDAVLSKQVCGEQVNTKIILSDNRKEGSSTMRCLGAGMGDEFGYDDMSGDGQVFVGDVRFMPGMHTMPGMTGPETFALRPTGAGGAFAYAKTSGGNVAMIGRGVTGPAQRFFIQVLAAAEARVRPFTYLSPNYTGESLHPTFHIPEIYIPASGYDSIKARVRVTRPLISLGALTAEAAPREKRSVGGDQLSIRQTGSLIYDSKQDSGIVKTETVEFPLFDDGTNGDGTANDRYWETALPKDFAKFDGEYTYRAFFTLCRNGNCIDREATQTVVVDVKLDPGATRTSVTPLQGGLASVMITPRDANGLLLGPGRADALRLAVKGDGKVQSVTEVDGKGTYAVNVSYNTAASRAALVVSQFGRPRDVIVVDLP